jgi:glyoxylase-like metal-dependent hydrolase (beta-lactamase superfamily II)
MTQAQPITLDSFHVAGMAVHRVEEFVDSNVDPMAFFPDLTPEIVAKHLHWIAPNFWNAARNTIAFTFQTWVLKSADHTVLVDTCNGNHKPRPYFPNADQLNTPYLERLKSAGCSPEDVDFVLCTHMHIDHVGWNTRLQDGRWVPTFPNAKYLFSRKEYEQYLPENYVDGKAPIFADVFEDSVLPVIVAGQGEIVEGRHEVTGEVTIDPAPGHTPGHYIVRASSRDETALFVGDAIHNPIQIAEPQLSTSFCVDGKMAADSRRRILEECAEYGHLLVPTHFEAPYIGHVRKDAEGFRFLPGR